jgi:D-alanyl-D-alanine-carboxypeptidase/D-alanyl-D-alanine-endopeptidase
MMRKILSLVLIVYPLCPARSVPTDTKTDSEVESILRDCVEKEKRSPGIIVGIIEGGHSRIISWGRRSASGGSLDGDTVFEIGSISKTFTAILFQAMVDRGELGLDDPAQKYLPETVKMPSRNGKLVTLRQLATHTSGLPRLPSNMNPKYPQNPYADYTVEQLYAFLSNCKLARDPGAQYEYSNLGMGLLGHILALKAGTNYEGLLLKEICGPLKMDSTHINLTPKLKERLATGHDHAAVVKNWDIPTLAGAGGIRSTMNDMLKYISANMGTADVPLSLAKAMDETHAIQTAAGSPEMSIGLAWHVRKKFGSEIVWHNGGTGGYHSFAGFDKSKKLGVVVLSNSSSDIDDIGWHLLNPEYKLK